MSGLMLGAFAPPLSEQLDSLGVSYDDKGIEHCQKDADAIFRLWIRDLITDRQKDAALRKLVKKIGASTIPTDKGGAT